LKLADKEIVHLKKALEASSKESQSYKRMVDQYRLDWTQSEEALREANKDVRSLASVSFFEHPVLWFTLGVVATVVIVNTLQEDSGATVVVPK